VAVAAGEEAGEIDLGPRWSSGFLSSIVVRLGHYAVWHIVYGDLICRC